jgi:REP element-mobilizing transposase RayT
MPRSHTKIYFHIVFGTKLRFPYIVPALREDLYGLLGGIVQKHGWTSLAIGGMPDHVHLLVRSHTWLSIPDLVKSLKGSSSHWINHSGKLQEHFGWQEGYGVFSVSPSNVMQARRYIENQERHHRDMSFEQEMRMMEQRVQASVSDTAPPRG